MHPQDVYLYAKKNAVCPEDPYGYVSGETGVSAACQATGCRSQGRIQIKNNTDLQAAMTENGYFAKYPGTNFRPWPYNGGYGEYTDAYVQLMANHLAIADVSGRCSLTTRYSPGVLCCPSRQAPSSSSASFLAVCG